MPSTPEYQAPPAQSAESPESAFVRAAMEKRAAGNFYGFVRMKGREGRWLVEIIDHSDCGRYVKVRGPQVAGNDWWVAAAEIQEPRGK